MWPFRRNVPPGEHASCARKYAELAERVEQLELASAERHLQVMEIAEKVAERLTERVRKRKDGKPEEVPPYQLILRRKHGLHEG
jgi:polysaccharide pyruvyl transferase WcaK-like protein